MSGKSRRHSALVNAAQKRYSITSVVNLNCLVRIFFLDGSSKLLQMYENSTVKDALIALKFNLDLSDISTHALFRVLGTNIRRLDLQEQLSDAMRDPTDCGQEVRLLFRNWISFKYGVYDEEVFQDGIRRKQPSTALWLAYMEATFMCMTGKYFLTEDESLLLGCLKMQAESGDFNPSNHSLQHIKQRVVARFPNPVRARMKALCTSTLAGNGLADDLAIRVQAIYARIAGKSKIDAQVDFLNTLRMWCPFYGSTFYEVQCQYDYSPLDDNNTPPVVAMHAAVGPLAIFLLTASDPPVIMRHPYKRIVKWVTHPDKHIFSYWVIRADVQMSDINLDNQTDFDARPYCDCVYLVSPLVREMEYVVHSYVRSIQDIAPHLPGAPEELMPPPAPPIPGTAAGKTSETDSPESASSTIGVGGAEKAVTGGRRATRLSVFLNALGGGSREGSGLLVGEEEGPFGDDTAAVATSLFKNMYRKGKSSAGEEDLSHVPSNVRFAADMTELKKVAEECRFSDDEDEDDDDDEEHSDAGLGEDEGSDGPQPWTLKKMGAPTQQQQQTRQQRSDSSSSSGGSDSGSATKGVESLGNSNHPPTRTDGVDNTKEQRRGSTGVLRRASSLLLSPFKGSSTTGEGTTAVPEKSPASEKSPAAIDKTDVVGSDGSSSGGASDDSDG